MYALTTITGNLPWVNISEKATEGLIIQTLLEKHKPNTSVQQLRNL